jgi:hypothetical protein
LPHDQYSYKMYWKNKLQNLRNSREIKYT